MTKLPINSRPRYQKIRELGCNTANGRITYLVRDNATGQLVVIKEFKLAKVSSERAILKVYEQEIKVLQSLDHPGIPRYLNSFENKTGFCLVQEYKDAQSLAKFRSVTVQEVKDIALRILDILNYLQERTPPVIHRNIKPENILIDEHLNVYLVDFGFARIGSGNGAMSSMAAGTFGFMAPEQIHNRKLSLATDLYGVGATLVCLLIQKQSTTIETLIDPMGRINFQPMVSELNPLFIVWLETMVQPYNKDRYASALVAKEALLSLSVTATPKVDFTPNHIQFIAKEVDEILTQTITVSNSTPYTILEGCWSVVSHPNDPQDKLNNHAWISFSPNEFIRNKCECSITVDTSKLIMGQVYQRQIVLQINSEDNNEILPIEVYTVSQPIPGQKLTWNLAFETLFIGVSYGSIALSIVMFIMAVNWLIRAYIDLCRCIGDIPFMIEMYRIIFLMLALTSASILVIKVLIEKVILKLNFRLTLKISIIITALFIGGLSLFKFSAFWGAIVTALSFLGVAYLVDKKHKKNTKNYRLSLLNRIKP